MDGSHWSSGALASSETVALRNLSEFKEFIKSHKGWIPEKFYEVEDATFSFVHIDVDLYKPTKDCIEFFYDRMNFGGIIVCDDYGFSTCPGATKAIDEFLSDKPEKMLPKSCNCY